MINYPPDDVPSPSTADPAASAANRPASADPGGAARLQHTPPDVTAPRYVTPLAGGRRLLPGGTFAAPTTPPPLVIDLPTDAPDGAPLPTEPPDREPMPTSTGHQDGGQPAGRQADRKNLRTGKLGT